MTAESRGWGKGWPQCHAGNKIVTVVLSTGARMPVHRDIAELVGWLGEQTIRRGYRIRREDTWGYACRAISGTRTPSNHSWGLAVDINAQTNPYASRLVTDMPSWMVEFWESHGFRWGGRYSRSKDAMHYEFMGTPTDAARITATRTQPASTPPPPPEDDDMALKNGPDIARWQQNLNYVITTDAPLKVDGVWGSTSLGRTNGFRRIWGLPEGDLNDATQGRPAVLDVTKMDRHIHELKEHGMHRQWRPEG